MHDACMILFDFLNLKGLLHQLFIFITENLCFIHSELLNPTMSISPCYTIVVEC